MINNHKAKKLRENAILYYVDVAYSRLRSKYTGMSKSVTDLITDNNAQLTILL